MDTLAALPVWLQIGVVLVGVVALGLLVVAQVMIWRTPAERLTAPRLVWALIAFVNIVGPIVFLLAGRTPAEVHVSSAPRHANVIDRAVVVLYGDEPRS